MQSVSDYRRLPCLVSVLIALYFSTMVLFNGCAPIPGPVYTVNPYPGTLHTQNGQEVAPPSWTNAPTGRANGIAPRIAQDEGAL